MIGHAPVIVGTGGEGAVSANRKVFLQYVNVFEENNGRAVGSLLSFVVWMLLTPYVI